MGKGNFDCTREKRGVIEGGAVEKPPIQGIVRLLGDQEKGGIQCSLVTAQTNVSVAKRGTLTGGEGNKVDLGGGALNGKRTLFNQARPPQAG